MKFAVYKLNFAAGVHLGTGTLASGANTLPADTLFSALCMEAAQQGGEEHKDAGRCGQAEPTAHWRSVSVYRRGTLPAETARAGSRGKRGQFHRKEELQEAEIYPGISAGYLFAG